MAEETERGYIPHTYTYGQFTVFFYGARVYLSGQSAPVGQCCVDIMNMDEAILDEIDRRVAEFAPAAWELLQKKTDTAAASAQKKLNAVWDVVFTMPVYQDLNMDADCNYHALENLFADKEKWKQVLMPHSEGWTIYQEIVVGLEQFSHSIRVLRRQIKIMTEKYFEPLERRNSAAYADAYSRFYADMLNVGAMVFNEEFEQSVSMKVSFVPMMHQTNEGEIFVAEKATFGSLYDFLWTEFCRGLALGNAPRRCHNCGKYFLLTKGYNTCYCGNIAPGETEQTCRKVGAHRKEARGKSNRSPAHVEYDRAYNRLKQKKNRGKITVDEWNVAVAEAVQVLERAERGEFRSDDEMRERFKAL